MNLGGHFLFIMSWGCNMQSYLPNKKLYVMYSVSDTTLGHGAIGNEINKVSVLTELAIQWGKIHAPAYLPVQLCD